MWLASYRGDEGVHSSLAWSGAGQGTGQQAASDANQEALRVRGQHRVTCIDFSFITTLMTAPTPMGMSVGFSKTNFYF